MAPLPRFSVQGNLKEILGNVVAGQLVETAMSRAVVIFTPNLGADWIITWEGKMRRVLPVVAAVNSDGEIVSVKDNSPVLLLAQDSGLNVRNLQWQVSIELPAQALPSSPSGRMRSFWFTAPAAGVTVPLGTVVQVINAPVNFAPPPITGGSGGPVNVDDIIGTGDVGRSLMRASDGATARTAMNAASSADPRFTDQRNPLPSSVSIAALADSLIVTAAETIAANDNEATVPTSAAVRQHVAARIAALIGAAPAELDTWVELVAAIQSEQSAITGINTALASRQMKDDTLTALAALTTVADRMIYATGPDQFALATLTAFARTLMTKASAAELRDLLSIGNVDNTSDATKPVSAAQQAAINAAVNGLLAGAPGQLDTLKELADAINDDANFAAAVTQSLATKYVKPASGIPLTDLVAAVQAQLGLASTAQQPMTTLATVSAASALTAGSIQPVNAQAGGLPATLPARSAANDNAYFGAQKASADTSVNAVTITPTGADLFDSGAASVALRLPGELRIVQGVTIGGVRQWKVVGGNTTVSSLDNRFQSQSMMRRPLNNRAVTLGDSISELGTDGLLYNPQNGFGWLPRLCISSRQRIRWDGIYAKGGATLINIRDTWLPLVLALNPRPGICFIFGGTNSQVTSATAASLAANVAVYMQIVEPLLAAGIVPGCVTIPPNDLSSGQFSASVRQWNRWIRRFAQRNGFPLLDAYTALVGANGSWKAGYSDDNLHPNGLGMKAIADQGIADGLPALLAPNGGQLTIRDTLDLTNLFGSGALNWGLFTTVSSTAGVGAGLTLAGTGTPSLVAAIAADGIMGSWQRIARASGDAGAGLVQLYAILGGWTPGDTLSLSFRVRTANVTAASPITVGTQITKTGGFTQNGQNVSVLKQGLVNITYDIEGTVHVEFTMPAGAEALVLNSIIIGNTSGQTVTVDVAELSIVNLTTGGVLV